MKKIILLVFVSFLINRISAQPYITSTVQVSNPSPCTLCCNGSIGYSINSYSCYTFPPVKIGLQSPTTGTVIQWNPNMSNLCNGTYTVIVDFMNSSSCGAVLVCSINYIFTTELKNNISENHKEIIIYPNPAYDLLNVKFETFNNEINKFEIYNNIGQLIQEEEISFKDNKAVIDTKGLENGVYVLKLQAIASVQANKKQTISKRFVVAR